MGSAVMEISPGSQVVSDWKRASNDLGLPVGISSQKAVAIFLSFIPCGEHPTDRQHALAGAVDFVIQADDEILIIFHKVGGGRRG